MLGVYVLTSHCNFKKKCVNVPHVNKTVTDFLGVYIPIYSLLHLGKRITLHLNVHAAANHIFFSGGE